MTPLLHLFARSLETGKFPNELKTAKIIPIYKNNTEAESTVAEKCNIRRKKNTRRKKKIYVEKKKFASKTKYTSKKKNIRRKKKFASEIFLLKLKISCQKKYYLLRISLSVLSQFWGTYALELVSHWVHVNSALYISTLTTL